MICFLKDKEVEIIDLWRFNNMGNWTGKWKSSLPYKCKCECGKENGAETWHQTFDADSLDAMEHDGETREFIRYFCEECINKYGSEREL